MLSDPAVCQMWRKEKGKASLERERVGSLLLLIYEMLQVKPVIQFVVLIAIKIIISPQKIRF